MACQLTEGFFDDSLVRFIQINRFLFWMLVKIELTHENHFEAHSPR